MGFSPAGKSGTNVGRVKKSVESFRQATDSGCTHYNTSHVAPQALSQNTVEMNSNGDNNPGQEKQHDLELGSSTTITDDDEPQHTNESETEAEVDSSSELHDHLPSTTEKFIPVALAFKNLFFSVKVRKGKNLFQKAQKKTFKDVHGELWPGEVTAIMGPSGFVPPLALLQYFVLSV